MKNTKNKVKRVFTDEAPLKKEKLALTYLALCKDFLFLVPQNWLLFCMNS